MLQQLVHRQMIGDESLKAKMVARRASGPAVGIAPSLYAASRNSESAQFDLVLGQVLGRPSATVRGFPEAAIRG